MPQAFKKAFARAEIHKCCGAALMGRRAGDGGGQLGHMPQCHSLISGYFRIVSNWLVFSVIGVCQQLCWMIMVLIGAYVDYLQRL